MDYPVTHTFTLTITTTNDVSRTDLLDTIAEHLDDFGYGEYWSLDEDNPDNDASTVGKVMVDETIVCDFEEES